MRRALKRWWTSPSPTLTGSNMKDEISPSDDIKDLDGAINAYNEGVQEAIAAVLSHIKRAKNKGYELETVHDSIKSKFALWETNILDTEALLESLEEN